MQLDLNIEKYRLHFATRSFINEKSNSAKAKGYIDLYVYILDEIMYVTYWKINFEYLSIDQFTTPTWFTNNCSNFRLRNSLFSKLNLKQVPRPNQSANLLYELNESELSIVNSWFNSDAYKSTLKNIISIIKGNNAGGSFANPKAAEMICTNLSESNAIYKENLIMFLDNIAFKNSSINDVNELNVDIYDSKISKSKTDINLFIHLVKNNQKFRSYALLLDLTANSDSLQHDRKVHFEKRSNYIKSLINETATKSRAMSLVNSIIKSRRAKASKMSINVFEKDCYTYENAHIYDVQAIKQRLSKIIANSFNDINKTAEMIIKSKQCQNALDSINDENNLINLPKQVHDWFDKNKFTYDQDGNIFLLDNELKINELYEFDKCTKIPNIYLNEKRKEYIALRNQFRKNNIYMILTKEF